MITVIAHAKRHLTCTGKSLQKYGDMALFPVKLQTSVCFGPLQVPLLMTVYLLVTFREFKMPGPKEEASQPEFFEIPPGYTYKVLKHGGFGDKKYKDELDNAMYGDDEEPALLE